VGVTPQRVARARSLSLEDRCGLLIRSEVLGADLYRRLGWACVDRAVMHAATALDAAGVAHGLRYLPPAGPETWRQIEAAAEDAAWAAEAAARAARAAGDAGAARDAARAAGSAARAARDAAGDAARAAERQWQIQWVVKALDGRAITTD
jgi:hypothetical protein